VELSVAVRGAAELARACRRISRDADKELREQAFDISKVLADRVKFAGAASDAQSARAARTVRERRNRFPSITAGPHPLLFGSEFGANGRFGWFGAVRYSNSPARQFRPHLGAGSYWFFRTADAMQPYVEAEWTEVAERLVEEWPRG
jgi:hypothetical protein